MTPAKRQKVREGAARGHRTILGFPPFGVSKGKESKNMDRQRALVPSHYL